jgi:hypothetical protein
VNETELQIVITAVNDAATALSEVGTSLSAMSEQASVAATSMTASMEGSFSATEQAAVAAAEATLAEWAGTADAIENATSGLGEEFQSQMEVMNSSAAAAADAAATSWQASIGELDTAMATATAEVGDDFGTMAEEASAASDEIESSISSVGGKIQAVGIQIGILGAAFIAPAAEAVKAAGDQTDAFDQLNNTVSNIYSNAGKPQAGLATEIADLTAQINTERASIGSSEAAMTKWNGTTAEVEAAHYAAGASITTAQLKIQDLQQKMDQLTNSQSLVGGSAAATGEQFEAAARASTTLGFNVSDSATALTYLFSTTQSVTETMTAYQDAMDLSAKLNIPLATAANDVVQAMNGQGRALRDLGVNVADGLAGQTALAAIQEKVAGSAQLAATQGLGPLAVAQANLNKAMGDFGVTVLPLLASFLEELTKIIIAVDAWAQAHPKLAEALIIFVALVGSLLILLGAILVPFGLLIIGIEAFTTALTVMEVSLFAAMGVFLIYAAAFLAFAAIVALIIAYHKQIEDAIGATWNWVVSEVRGATTSVMAIFTTWGGDLTKWWTTLWAGIVSVLQNAFTVVIGIVNSILAAVAKVTGAVAGVTGALGGAVGNVVGGAIHAFATGGIVNGPTLALVGEAGPEAIIPLSAFNGGSSLGGGFGGGSGGIVVNINGGSYLDQNGATQIANALAVQIGRQIKLKNY